MMKHLTFFIALVAAFFFSCHDSTQELKLVLPIGHTESVNSVQFSPDGKTIVTASSDNTAKVWDVATGKELHSLEGHSDGVNSAQFSPDGIIIVTASYDETAKLWDVDTGEELLTLKGHSEIIEAAQFSPDGKTIVTASRDSTAKVWDVATGKEFHTLEGHTDWVTTAQFSPDGKTIVTASEDGTTKVWDVDTGKELHSLEGHFDGVNSAQFSPNGKTIVTASWDKTAKVWDVDTGKELYTLKGHSNEVVSAQFSPDGKIIVTASYDGTAKVWDVATGKELHSLEGHYSWSVNSAQFSPDGKTIVTTSWDNTAKVWDTSTGKELHSLEGHSYWVTSAQFSPDGKTFVTASNDNTAKVWEAATGMELHSLEGHSVPDRSAQFCPGRMTILTAAWDSTAKVWDAATGKALHSLEGHSYWVTSAQFSPDGKTIVTASDDGTAKVWDVDTGKELYTLEGHLDRVRSAQFSTDGRIIVTTSWDITAKVWDVDTGKDLHTLEGHSEEITSAQFSLDGMTLLTASLDSTAKVWDVATGKELYTLRGHSNEVVSAQFSPDGKIIVTASRDSTAKVWDVATGKEFHTLEGHIDWVTTAQFSPDGKTIVTASVDGTAKVWDVATGKELHTLEGHSGSVHLAQFSPDGMTVLTTSLDNTAKVWDVDTGRGLHSLEGHLDRINSAQFSPDGMTILTASEDNTAKLWDATTGQLLFTRLSMEDGGWLAWDPEHRYDGSLGAIEQLHFACGLEVIGLEQAEDALHVPGLVDYIMRGVDLTASGKTTLAELNLCNQTPAVHPLGRDDRGWLYEIEERDGGLSRCEIHVNGRLAYEVPQKQLPMQESGRRLLIVPESSVAKYISGDSFEIRVVARTLDGQLQSRSTGETFASVERLFQDAPPQFHGLFVGINEYASQDLQLNYAAADALEFSEAMVHAAGAFFGADRVHSKVLITGATGENKSDGPAFKTAILNALEDIAEQSAPNDVVFLHFAGHGKVNSDNAFVFLSADASSKQLEYSGLTMQELNALLASIPANNRILVLDACESGAALGELDKQPSGARSDDTEKLFRESQLNRLKKDADLAVITAAAAGQEAFELHEVGHGKLTFALLDALDSSTDIFEADGATVDVNRWFQSVQNALRDGSLGLGNGQDVQVMSARESYPVGKVDEALREAIQIERKPVVNDIVMLNSNSFPVKALEEALKTHCRMAMANGRAPSASVMFREGQVDGLIVRGLKVIREDDGTYSLNLDLLQGEETVIGSTSIQGGTVEAIWLEVQELAKLIQQ